MKCTKDNDYRPNKVYTTFDEGHLEVSFKKNIRDYRIQCQTVERRSFDVDESYCLKNIVENIKYLDLREYAFPLFKFIIHQMSLKKFVGFWDYLSFFTAHLDTPLAVELLEQNI